MYEAEVNRHVEPVDSLSEPVLKRFAELRALVKTRTTLPWGEHCTECAWPTCYTTCELYSPREDGACRLFVEGMVRVDVDEPVRPYLLKIRFKQWGKLWTVGNLALYAPDEAIRKERNNIRIGTAARTLPLPRPLKARVLSKVAYLRRRASEVAAAGPEPPDCFLLECYNPNPETIELSFTVRPRQPGATRAFQRIIRVPEGFVREQVGLKEIARAVELAEPFELEIVPNEAENKVLYFGLLDFVQLRATPGTEARKPASGTAKQWKCIVWDLDNTLWDGTLIEDGADRLRLRHDVVEVIREMDRRGILLSVASKNNEADAMAVLRASELAEYFLHPQIGWGPKSEALARIAQRLNIGLDTLAFVDDQPFERAEVASALPQVAIVDARDCLSIPMRPECQVPVTEESRQRRLMYRQEEERERILESLQGDYTQFLRECRIELSLSELNTENVERVYELAQRTNQMNFSGARYSRNELEEFRRSRGHETYVMRCSDRFGSYGIIGFAVVDAREPRLLDLMFSCRVQSKRVEHAFLGHVLRKFADRGRRDFFANYRKTDKNTPSGKVFEDVGFEVVGEEGGVLSLVFLKEREIPDDGIVRIVEVAGDSR
jgi:FkbH-like protein